MTLRVSTTKVGATLKNGGGLLETYTLQTEDFGLCITDLKTKEKRRIAMSKHTFIKDNIGFKVQDVDEGLAFEGTIGALNDVLEENFNCVICYDESTIIHSGEIMYHGFAIQAKEDSNE